MQTMLMIAGLILKMIGTLLTNQLFWIVILLLIIIYKKSSKLEEAILGNKFSLFDKVTGSIFAGFIGGLLGSFLVIFLGITIEEYIPGSQQTITSGILYIWIVAILLSLINPRYLCFSYAGGIIAVINLLTGFPNINVSGLMALIGILHLIESFLIWFDGSTYSLPMFLKSKNGEIVGGYVMNKIWPIPLVLLAFGFPAIPGSNVIGIQNMPSWWPVIAMKQTGNFIGGSTLGFLPFMIPVVLGYGDMAVTRTSANRCRVSALRLAGYSIILVLLAVAASRIRSFAYIAAIFAPVAHELLILQGKTEEQQGIPFFKAVEQGVRVLFCRANSPGRIMDIEPGDVILSINNNAINNETQLTEFLSGYPSYVWLEIKKNSGKIVTAEYQDYQNGVRNLGLLIIPKNINIYYEFNEEAFTIKRIIMFIKRKIKKSS